MPQRGEDGATEMAENASVTRGWETAGGMSRGNTRVFRSANKVHVGLQW